MFMKIEEQLQMMNDKCVSLEAELDRVTRARDDARSRNGELWAVIERFLPTVTPGDIMKAFIEYEGFEA